MSCLKHKPVNETSPPPPRFVHDFLNIKAFFFLSLNITTSYYYSNIPFSRASSSQLLPSVSGLFSITVKLFSILCPVIMAANMNVCV